MVPFAGEGVILITILLGEPLAAALKGGLDRDRVWKAMGEFEEEMFTRAGGTV